MTTPVIISSLGGHPDHVVHVHTVSRNAEGRFERGELQPHVLKGGDCVQIYVYDGVQLEIHEHDTREVGARPGLAAEG